MGRNCAIVLAAGNGSRMNSKTKKQYLLLAEKPVLYYSLKAFEDHPDIDDIILVTGEDDIIYCRTEIVEKYELKKVRAIISGGKERYHSVYRGLLAAKDCEFVLIHDGARPFVTSDMLERLLCCVKEEHACVAGMPVKDTIKIADEQGYAEETPRRDRVWQIQTPQVFEYHLIRDSYDILMSGEQTGITDDAMVLERTKHRKVKLVEGSYRNIKITTPEDLEIAELFVEKIEK